MVSSHEEAVAEIIRIVNGLLKGAGEGPAEVVGSEYNIYQRISEVAVRRISGAELLFSVPSSLRGDDLESQVKEVVAFAEKKAELEKADHQRWACCNGLADKSLPNGGHEGDCRSSVRFRRELRDLLTRYSREDESGTPDFILAYYLLSCLKAFEEATNERASWYDGDRHDRRAALVHEDALNAEK